MTCLVETVRREWRGAKGEVGDREVGLAGGCWMLAWREREIRSPSQGEIAGVDIGGLLAVDSGTNGYTSYEMRGGGR